MKNVKQYMINLPVWGLDGKSLPAGEPQHGGWHQGPKGLPFGTQVLPQALLASASSPHLLALLFSPLVASGWLTFSPRLVSFWEDRQMDCFF